MGKKEVRSIVISGYGTNCEMEMAYACQLGGSEGVDIVHIHDLITGEKRLDDYHFLNLPEGVYLPIRLGEGKFIPKDGVVQRKLKEKGLIALQYSDEGFCEGAMEYPLNPNGSTDTIAGICDRTGRLLGMMPHPEAYHHRTDHPR